MQILKDGGAGITQKSLEFFHKHKEALGEIVEIKISTQPLTAEINLEWGCEITYKMFIIGTHAEMWLSGCNCGYGGEGPSGSRKILEELGWGEPEVLRQLVTQYEKIHLIKTADGRIATMATEKEER